MTALALFRGRFVEKHVLAVNRPNFFVASSALHVLMQAFQSKGSPFVVVKHCGLPFGTVVTVNASRDAILGKLLAVDFFMAFFTLGRSRSEIGSNKLGLHVRRLVAVNTCGRLVRPHQSKRCRRMVEARQLFPRFRRVAGFAASRRSIGAKLLHALGELSFVRILVTGHAG